jgi:hypothetical protein
MAQTETNPEGLPAISRDLDRNAFTMMIPQTNRQRDDRTDLT